MNPPSKLVRRGLLALAAVVALLILAEFLSV